MLYAKTDKPFVVRLRNKQDELSGYVDVWYGSKFQCETVIKSLQDTLPTFVELWLLDTVTLINTWYTTGAMDMEN